MDSDNLWKKQISEKSGKIYFVNTITSEIFETSVYETDSYIKIQTIDGQVQIPEDALVVLRQWSDIFDTFSRWNQDSIPNLNVSSSYLTRLISIARASFQYESVDPSFEGRCMTSELTPPDENSIDNPSFLKFQIKKQIYYMFNLHTKDKFTEFYDKEIGITYQMKEFFNELTGYNCFCENILYVIRNHYENYREENYPASLKAAEVLKEAPQYKIENLHSSVSRKYDIAFETFCNENREKVRSDWKPFETTDGRTFFHNTLTGVSEWNPSLSDKEIEELKRLWIILKKSTNEDDKNYVSGLETEEKEIKERYDKDINMRLKSLWDDLDEKKRLEFCLDELTNVGVYI